MFRHVFPSLICATILVLDAGLTTSRAETRIGLSLPLTGPAAKLARQFETGALLAIEAYNTANEEDARLIVADDGCKEDVAQLAIEEIRDADPHIITGLLCNATTTAFANAFKEGPPLLIAGAQSERLIKDRERNEWLLWRLSPGDNEGARAAVDYFAEAWKKKPYAIVDDGTVYGRNLADAFRASMEEHGLPPQFQDNFRPTQSTQARLVRRLRRAGVAHAFIGASAEDVAMIARNAELMEIDMTIGSGEALSILPFMATELQPKGGITAVLKTAEVTPDIPESLQNRLAELDLQAEPYVLTGYQAVEVALQAVTDSHEATIQNLTKGSFKTLLGAVRFAADGDNTQPQFSAYEWREGAFRKVE